MKTRILRKGEKGSSVVEFAIVSTILVPLIMYSMFFVDIAKVRLKTQEMARYAVWEMTSFPLSDYDSGSHTAFFNQASQNVSQDVVNRYSDDLRADTVSGKHVDFTTGVFEFSSADITIKNQDTKLLPGGQLKGSNLEWVGDMLNQVNGGINWLLGSAWKFNTKGQIRVDVAVHFKQNFIPKVFTQEFYENELAPEGINNLKFEDHLVLVADSWTLLDGQSVYPPGGYKQHDNDALLYKQTNRVLWLGATQIPLLGSILNFFAKIQNWPLVRDLIDVAPFAPRVASSASRGDDPNKANDLKVDVDCGETEIHTTPMRDKQLDPRQSEYGKTYVKRGDWYMGCPESEKESCFR
jgi:hypothetical protein